MNRKLMTLLVLLSLSYVSMACSCSFGGPFVKVSKKSDLSIVAKITAKSSGKLTVEIEKILLGQLNEKALTIIGDQNGASCYKALHNFKQGETYAFALTKENGKYYLSACGEYSVKIQGSQVQGMVTDAYMTDNANWPQWNNKNMPVDEFYKLFENTGKVYAAPCKAVIPFEDSQKLSDNLAKAKEAAANGASFQYSDFNQAVRDNNLPLVEFYVEQADLMNHSQFSDLMFTATESGYKDIVDLFLDNNADAGMKDGSDFYLIYRSVLYPELLKHLNNKGAELNPKGYVGTTTIMHAVREGCIESIAYLIDNGADLNEKSNKGNKVKDYVKYNRKNPDEVKAYLKSRK